MKTRMNAPSILRGFWGEPVRIRDGIAEDLTWSPMPTRHFVAASYFRCALCGEPISEEQEYDQVELTRGNEAAILHAECFAKIELRPN
jgi:hypothetical protein